MNGIVFSSDLLSVVSVQIISSEKRHHLRNDRKNRAMS